MSNLAVTVHFRDLGIAITFANGSQSILVQNIKINRRFKEDTVSIENLSSKFKIDFEENGIGKLALDKFEAGFDLRLGSLEVKHVSNEGECGFKGNAPSLFAIYPNFNGGFMILCQQDVESDRSNGRSGYRRVASVLNVA